jgi:hypothetical protein
MDMHCEPYVPFGHLVTSLLIFGKFSRQLLHIIYYWTIGLEQLVAILGQIIKNQWLVHINTWVFKQKKKS